MLNMSTPTRPHHTVSRSVLPEELAPLTSPVSAQRGYGESDTPTPQTDPTRVESQRRAAGMNLSAARAQLQRDLSHQG